MGVCHNFCVCTAKTVLIVINLVFWIIAGVLIYVAATLLSQYGQNNPATATGSKFIVAPAVLFICIGVLLLFTGALSCCAVTNNNRCMAMMFFTLMMCIIALEAVVVIYVYTQRDEMTREIYRGLYEAINKYTDKEYTEAVDKLQEFLRCCGVANYTDWVTTPWGLHNKSHVPTSCCRQSELTVCVASMNQTQQIYTNGCGKKMEDILVNSSDVSAWIAMGFAIFEVFGLLAAVVVISNHKRTVPYLDLDSERPV